MAEEVLDLSPQQRHFTFKGNKYVLEEASEPAVIAFRTAQFKGLKVGEDGKPVPDYSNLTSQEQAQTDLVAECVRVPGGDNNGLLEAVKKWPHRTIKRLFGWLEEMSDLKIGAERTIDEQIAALEKQREELRAKEGAAKN